MSEKVKTAGYPSRRYQVIGGASLLIACLLLNLLFFPAYADDAGYALRFDGNSDFVELPETVAVFDAGWESTKTVALWVKPDGPQTDCTLTPDPKNIAKCPYIFGDRPSWWGITIGRLPGPDQNRIWVWNFDGSMGSIADFIGIEYTPGEWVHIALVHNNGMLRAYKNGVEVGSTPSGPTLQPLGGGNKLNIGGVIVNSTEYWLFKGDVDEMSLWNRALSPAEISANMYRETPINTSGLAAFYRMSDGAGMTLTDDSGNGNTGTLYDGARGLVGDGQPPQWVASGAFNVNGPSVTINQADSQADPTSSSPIHFTVVFSEPVTDFTTGDVTLSGSAGATTAIVTGSGATYDVAVSGMTSSGLVIATINAGMAHNALGDPNQASTSTDNTVAFQTETSGPTVTINQAIGQADPTTSSPINFTVVFSEPVTDFAAGDVSLSGTAGATTAIVTGSGTTYNVAISGMYRTGTVIATVPPGVAHNASNLPNSASTSSDNIVDYVDNVSPTVTINQAPGQPDPAYTAPIYFQVIFSEPVSDFGTTDVSLSGTAAGPLLVAIDGSGAIYDVIVSGMSSDGTVVAAINAGATHDASGNPNAASISSDNSIYFVFAPNRLYLPLLMRP